MTDDFIIDKDPAFVQLIDSMGTSASVIQAARVSIGGQKPKSTDVGLLKYLWKHGHTSPFEHVSLQFRVECPIFVARQFMRHRTFSYNEISGRYSVLPQKYYVPGDWYVQSTENKQGTDDQIAEVSSWDYLLAISTISKLYDGLIAAGVAREQARFILPLSTYTSFYTSGNLLNWLKFLKLRLTDEAQYEIWLVALQIASFVRDKLPEIWEIVEEDICGKREDFLRSRNFARAVREGRVRRESWETPKGPSSHYTEEPEEVS